MALAVEQAGATAVIDLLPTSLLRRLVGSTPEETLRGWDHYRRRLLEQVSGVLEIAGSSYAMDGLPEAPLRACRSAAQRLTVLE